MKEIVMTSLFYHMSFRSPKMKHCFNSIRYYGASIENICCHQPPSTMTQFVRIYDHIRVSFISQNLLLTSVYTQYPLNVESLCNILTWWIMTTNSTQFNINFIQYVTIYTSALTIGTLSWWSRQVIPLIRR